MNTIFTFFKQLDKLLHILVSYGLTLTLAQVMPLPYAAEITLAIGAAKEGYDYKFPLTHTADWKDFLADSIGVAAACAVYLAAPFVVAYVRVTFGI